MLNDFTVVDHTTLSGKPVCFDEIGRQNFIFKFLNYIIAFNKLTQCLQRENGKLFFFYRLLPGLFQNEPLKTVWAESEKIRNVFLYVRKAIFTKYLYRNKSIILRKVNFSRLRKL